VQELAIDGWMDVRTDLGRTLAGGAVIRRVRMIDILCSLHGKTGADRSRSRGVGDLRKPPL
jgi:hypothetical protein